MARDRMDDVSDGTADDAALRRVAAALREPSAADRALEARAAAIEANVMRAIARPADETLGRTEVARPLPTHRPWLLRPRTVSVRPLTALATAAAVLLAVGVGASVLRDRAPVAQTTIAAAEGAPSAVAPAADTVRIVQFVLLAPGAREVALVGDFNHWQGGSTPLHRASAAGLWTVELPLPAGRYTYTFVVDGSHFTPDPAAPRALADDFGTPSSVITVGGGHT